MTIERTLTMIGLVSTHHYCGLVMKCNVPTYPDVFGESQQYIAFLLENSGMQLGSYVVSIPLLVTHYLCTIWCLNCSSITPSMKL